MIYTINILKKSISCHQNEVEKLKSIDEVEMNAEQIFIDNEIENHELSILELQSAINILLKHNQK